MFGKTKRANHINFRFEGRGAGVVELALALAAAEGPRAMLLVIGLPDAQAGCHTFAPVRALADPADRRARLGSTIGATTGWRTAVRCRLAEEIDDDVPV